MKRVPPKPVRRVVVAPLVAAVDAALLLASPVLLLVAVLLGPLLGGTRAARAVLVVALFAARHLQTLLGLLALWLRRTSGDAAVDAHYDLMHRFVTGVVGGIVRLARVEVVHVDSDAAFRALAGDRPVVLLSRHAGEGDTLLVIHELLSRHGRRPRVVMHEALRLDPLIDVLGGRVPNRFVDPRGGDIESDIAELASDLDGRSALVIFPEGANFTEERRRRAIDRLTRRGHVREAAAAETMRRVSAPRPGGALAAIEAADRPDVVIMGHVGFPSGLGEAWRLLPKRQTIEIRLWHEPADTLPEGRDDRIEWLFDRWSRLDDWVREREA